MGRLKGHMIYRVAATELLPLRERPLHDADEDTYLALVKNLLSIGPMYFSYTFDVTNAFQRQTQADLSAPLWKRADDRFFWNRFVQTDLINLRLGAGRGGGSLASNQQREAVDPYILPVMFGMMRITNTSVKGQRLTFILITRRSRHRAGTRYFSRGIDAQGHVSNFNETEQAIILNDDASSGLCGYGNGAPRDSKTGQEVHVLSYVQTRGSVPVYWAEVNTLKYTPSLQIRGVESAVKAAKLHFDEQIRLYGDNYLVNLVNQKGRERRVKDAYEQMVKLLNSSHVEDTKGDDRTSEKFHVIEPDQARHQYDRLHYVYFDFHNETKGLKWHRAQLLLDQLEGPLQAQQYFHGVDKPGDQSGQLEIRKLQRGVVRTNCMDCLDRTNVVQSMLGRYTLSRMLQDIGILRPGEAAQEDAQFEHVFRNVWADNADVVSKSYSGTGALKTDFTRTGNRTRAGMLQDLNNSITRYVKNNFTDGPRQDSFDLFLGTYIPSMSDFGSAQFVDRRPILVQSIPYIMAASLLFILVSLFTRRVSDAAVWPLRIWIVIFAALFVWCANFLTSHGTLYVSLCLFLLA